MSKKTYPHAAFNAADFSKQAHALVELLSTHLSEVSTLPVMPTLDLEQSYKELNVITQNATDFDVHQFFEKVIASSMHLQHPHDLGHQVTTSLPLAALSNFLAAFLNNNSNYFELGPIHVVLEKIIIDWMSSKIGFSTQAGGFLTSGGSLANLTALLAARQIKSNYDVWNEGYRDDAKFVFFMSNQAHYCIKRAVQTMGLGNDAAILVDTDEHYAMDMKALEKAYNTAKSKNLIPICVIASACNTGPGTFDNLNEIADFCEKNDLWFHVDGAHGASTLLSNKYNPLLAGIERADSVIWDLHKMLMMPSLATAVIFKREEDSYQALKHEAPYIMSKSENYSFDWKAPVKRSMECTKNSMALHLYICLMTYGEQFFADHINQTFDQASAFAKLIEQDDNLELAVVPQSNIVCFRYRPTHANQSINLNDLQEQIRKEILDSGEFYIVKTTFNDQVFLRISIMNPNTSPNDLNELFDLVKKLGHKLSITV